MSFVICHVPIFYYFCFIVLYVFLTIFVFCDLNYFSLRILLFVTLVQNSKDYCQRVETQLQYINIVPYRNTRTKK